MHRYQSLRTVTKPHSRVSARNTVTGWMSPHLSRDVPLNKVDFERYGLYKDFVGYIGSSRPASCTMKFPKSVNIDYILSAAHSPEPTIFDYDFDPQSTGNRSKKSKPLARKL